MQTTDAIVHNTEHMTTARIIFAAHGALLSLVDVMSISRGVDNLLIVFRYAVTWDSDTHHYVLTACRLDKASPGGSPGLKVLMYQGLSPRLKALCVKALQANHASLG